ncbi:ATP-binding protein [Streptomyces silvensis]|uniref:Histidine kinase/HSP90-like ATPase domain-containing protein n=1 Tax=Streptomyces silvensis TaxID=1765722 RepID=A0A0W7X195_9ACTN|nr:ATP-binding protein [Streptomyces silvensis]KUF16579.1 hypothetical protein AT728_12470 [Streptomyces silvensis]
MNDETSPQLTYARYYRRERHSVPAARAYTRAALAGWRVTGPAAADILLAVSELTTNALTHGVPPGRGFLLRLRRDGAAVRVEVHDSGGGRPRPAKGGVGESGRGLLIVSALADKWGVEPRDPGKVVWAEFAQVSGVAPPPQGSPGPR